MLLGPSSVRLGLQARVAHRLEATPKLFAAALRARALYRLARRSTAGGRHARQVDPASGSVRVRGFWRDNWVGHRLDVVVDASEHSRSLSLVGRPVSDMTVTVTADGSGLGHFELRAGHEEDLVVDIPAGPREQITFSFSDHAVDADGRAVAFLLQETNAFREADLYSLG
jgi:hypothetical protein